MLSCNRSISQTKQQQSNHFLYKTELDTSKGNYGMHIEVKQVLPDTNELIPMSIDDRDIIGRSKYVREEQIKLLGEYLTYRGDTNTSNKRYRFKAGSHMVSPEGIKGFTVEVEALYSFTRMLTQGLPPIKPALISRVTGEQLNTNPKVVSEVYDIYTRWYKENAKTDFKNIILPLTGSSYCWLGEDKGMELFLKKSF
ncbi:hypothetical protein OI18_15205 [Flavihumibacter solisilvae]|uniref:Uncharacterized protein n=2 Tax=Flavihumibacter solisilvae TaxID=1349421 RepID=A0A0C1L1N4_9BACT|nr:hypothetical protein OI18_15205 [Flavihumibacter solisilvae]